MDGTTCAMSSPFTDFSMFDYTTIILYIYGDKRSDLQSTTGTLLNQYVSDVTTQTSSSFQSDFNEALAGAGILDLFSTITIQTAPSYNAPVMGTSKISAQSTDTVITITGLSLSSGAGVFYAIADSDSTGAPTRYQVRVMVNNDDTPVNAGGTVYTSDTVSLSIPDLIPETDYTVYFYGTNEDRTQYAPVTSLYSLQISTQAAGFMSASSRMEINFTFIFALFGALYALLM